MIEDKLSKNIDKILNELYGNNSYEIQFQKTRKEFKGDITLVVFPFTKFSKKSPEITAEEIGEKLVLSDQINKVIQAVNKIGLAVRGLYGEGTEALGNLFQVSNQHTLGESEEEIIARLEKVIKQIIEHEENAREKLYDENKTTLNDKIGRSYAILRYAHIISTKEALELLSMLRLGVDLGYFSDNLRDILNEW